MTILKNSFQMLARLSTVGFPPTKNSIELLRQPGLLNRMQPALCRISELQKRSYFTHELCQNLSYLTNNGGIRPKVNPTTMKLDVPIERPLCIMLCWLGSTPKYVGKYAEIYLDQGFDMVTARVPMFQCLFPEMGVLQSIKNLLLFMEANNNFNPSMLHSFSIGTFSWAEICVLVKEDPERFLPVINRLGVQVWDSMVDIDEFRLGVSRAFFPNSTFLENMCIKYITLHQKVFHDVSTKYFHRASVNIRKNLCQSDALILCSDGDIVGPGWVNNGYAECWRKMGTNVTVKCWESSPHVGHYRQHPDEYLIAIGDFLEKHNMLFNKPALEHKIAMFRHQKKTQLQ